MNLTRKQVRGEYFAAVGANLPNFDNSDRFTEALLAEVFEERRTAFVDDIVTRLEREAKWMFHTAERLRNLCQGVACRSCWATHGKPHEKGCLRADEVSSTCEMCGSAHWNWNAPEGDEMPGAKFVGPCQGSGGRV